MDIKDIIDNEDISSKDINSFPVLPQEINQMLTSSEHEIVIDLNINLLSRTQNDVAAIPENKQIYNNNYWIPVPSGNNPDEYILAFIKHFEKSMANSINQ